MSFFLCVCFNAFTFFLAAFMLATLCHVGNTCSILDEDGMRSTYPILSISTRKS